MVMDVAVMRKMHHQQSPCAGPVGTPPPTVISDAPPPPPQHAPPQNPNQEGDTCI